MLAVFRDTDAVLTLQIDPLILPLRKTDPDFYALYRATREIIDRPGPRLESQPRPTVAAPTANPAPQQLAA